MSGTKPNTDPNEKNDLIKMIEKYGYNMKPQEGGSYYIMGLDKIYIPLGANNQDEEFVLKSLGFDKTENSKH